MNVDEEMQILESIDDIRLKRETKRKECGDRDQAESIQQTGRETPELREEVQGAADEETNIEYLSPSRQIETLNQTPPPA